MTEIFREWLKNNNFYKNLSHTHTHIQKKKTQTFYFQKSNNKIPQLPKLSASYQDPCLAKEVFNSFIIVNALVL